MEETPNVSPGEADTKSSTEKRRGRLSRFLSGWLQRRNEPFSFGAEGTETEQAASSTEQSATEVEGKPEKKKQRRQRFINWFRRPFSREVEPEFIDGTPEKQPKTRERVEEIKEAEAVEPELSDLVPEVNETAAEPASAPMEATVYERAVELPGPATDHLDAAPAMMAQTAAAEQLVAPFRSTEARTPVPEKTVERVVESKRGTAAVGVLLGLEYFGRKRGDRKERRVRQEQTKQLNKKISEQQAVNQQAARAVEGRVQTVEEELKAVRMQRQSFEKQLIEEAEQAAKIESEKAPQVVERPEVKTTQLREVEKLPLVEKLIKEETRQRPEVVLERVEVAAEQNIPIEALYERRHEVKDHRPQAGMAAGLAFSGAPAGSLQPVAAGGADEQFRTALGEHIKDLRSGRVGQPGQLYKNAALSGVWGALIILAFAGVLYVLG